MEIEKAIFRDCFSHDEDRGEGRRRRHSEKQEGVKKVKYSSKVNAENFVKGA